MRSPAGGTGARLRDERGAVDAAGDLDAEAQGEFALRTDVEERCIGIGAVAAIDDAESAAQDREIRRSTVQRSDPAFIEKDIAVAHQVAQQLLARAIGRKQELSEE